MAEQFFQVPKIGSGGENDGYRPKYSDLDGVDRCSVQWEFPENSEYIALFQGDEKTIDEIAENDDATPVTEAEVGRLQLGGNGKGPTEGGPQPPQIGKGDTIEEKVEDFIENTTGSSFIITEGNLEFSKPLQFRRSPGFYEGYPGLLSLTELRRLPQYLIDVLLRPETAVILPEHYGYWRWTTQFVDFVISNGDEFENLTSQSDDEVPDFGYGGIVQDFLNTVGLVAYPRRLEKVDNRVSQFIQEMAGLPNRANESAILRLFGPNSLSILDGLVKRRCDLNEDGNIEGTAVELTWRPNSPEETGLNYHDRLQYWRHYPATDEVKDTLCKIDQLQRYDLKYLRHMGGVLGNTDTLDEELSSTNHFLRVVGTSQRNYNIHGNGSAPSIAPIVLSLCCLIFWDMIDEETYQRYQEEILQRLRNQ